MPKVKTNFGKFNIRFVGPKTWNEIDETFKNCNKYKFKKKLKNNLLQVLLECVIYFDFIQYITGVFS
jgi:hypothetical protein